MSRKMLKKEQPVRVLCGMDDQDESLIRSGLALAAKLELPLEIVHVFESILVNQRSIMFPINFETYGITDHVAEIDAKRRKKAEKFLNEKSKSTKDVAVSSKMLEGSMVEEVLEYEKEHPASLNICGCKGDIPRALPAGFSYTLGMISRSQFPTLVIPTDSDFSKNPLKRVLLADDLTDQSLPAVQFSGDLNELLKTELDIVHLHVNKMIKDKVDAFFLELYATASGRPPAMMTYEELVEEAKGKIEEQMESRWKEADVFISSNHRPVSLQKTAVKQGDTVDIIGKVSSEEKVDCVIFGRHASMRKSWIPFGQVSYRAMIDLDRPFVVVPNENLMV